MSRIPQLPALSCAWPASGLPSCRALPAWRGDRRVTTCFLWAVSPWVGEGSAFCHLPSAVPDKVFSRCLLSASWMHM